MSLQEKFSRLKNMDLDWRKPLAQGILILIAGLFLALISALNPNAVVMHAQGLSFLPFGGIALLFLGFWECLDALLTKDQREFVQNLQVGMLDTVVGGLIVLSVGQSASRLSLMIAAFLMVRGSVRVVMSNLLKLPHAGVLTLGGLASVAMGLMIWNEWPSGNGWFLALCLSLEIACRGWAMIMFALWVQEHEEAAETS